MFATHPPETDLLLPGPDPGEELDPHLVYTYASLLSLPDAGLCAFLYVKCKPCFPLAEGGFMVFRGLANVDPIDMAYTDYQFTMPWPGIEDGVVALANGVRVDVVEPGARLRLSYRSPDGRTALDVESTAVTPLLARGHVIPGEERHDATGARVKGGSEQMMHSVGELVLHGERFAVDCVDGRDRSWGQRRSEFRDDIAFPPAIWTPMWFGDDLAFNQVGYEHPDTDPSWAGVFDVPADRPTHHNAWVIVGGDVRAVCEVRVDVHARHPFLIMPTALTVGATDATGQTHAFRGEALAMTALPTWPQSVLRQAMYRWESADGRACVSSGQEMWWDQAYQHALNARAGKRALVEAAL